MKISKIFLLLFALTGFSVSAGTPILGKPTLTVEQMYQYVMTKNPGSSFTKEFAQEFYDQGTKYGIRGDIALCQSCIETGWFRYEGGTAVTPDDHNYCGLGVTQLGKKGCQFSSIKEGISAQLQHLWAYATTKSLPSGWTLVDPRFNYVTKGQAPNWEDLGSGKWAAAAGYGDHIISIYNAMKEFTPVVAEPSLTVSKTSVSLTGEKGATAPSVTITITGANLTSDILYNSSTSVVTLSTSSWNARTGGKLKITLDTSKNSGTYTGYVAVQTGSGSSLIRHQINITATITDPVTSDVELPTEFSLDWSVSGKKGNTTSFMNPDDDLTRNMILKDGKLYIVRRGDTSCDIHIVDAFTGSEVGTLPTTGITKSNFMFSSVGLLSDGNILACNLGYSATTVLNVYAWKSDTAKPQLVLTTTNHGGRSGDLMSVSGTLENGKIFLTTNSGFDGYKGRVMVYTIKNGTASATPSVITLKKADGSAYDLGGTFAVIEIQEQADGTLMATGAGGTTAWFKANGTFIKELNAVAVDNRVEGSSCAIIPFGGRTLAAVTSYKKAQRIRGYLNLVDITDTANPTVVHSFAALREKPEDTSVTDVTEISNPSSITTALAKAEGSNIHLWVIIPKQGMAKYTATAKSSAVDMVESEATPSLVRFGNTVSVAAENVTLEVYNLSGIRIASERASEIELPSLPGIYVVVARMENGNIINGKFVVR